MMMKKMKMKTRRRKRGMRMEWCSNHSNTLGIADHMEPTPSFLEKAYVANIHGRKRCSAWCPRWFRLDALRCPPFKKHASQEQVPFSQGWNDLDSLICQQKWMLVSFSSLKFFEYISFVQKDVFPPSGRCSIWLFFLFLPMLCWLRPAWETHRQWSGCTEVLSILDVAVRFDVSPLVQFAVLWLVEFWQISGSMVHPVRVHYTDYTATSDSSDFLVHVWYGNPAKTWIQVGELWFIMFYPGVYARWVSFRGLWTSIFRSLCPTPPLINWAAIGTHSNSIEICIYIYTHTFSCHFSWKWFQVPTFQRPLASNTSTGKRWKTAASLSPASCGPLTVLDNTSHSRCSSSKTTLLRNMLVGCWRHGGLGRKGGKTEILQHSAWIGLEPNAWTCWIPEALQIHRPYSPNKQKMNQTHCPYSFIYFPKNY